MINYSIIGISSDRVSKKGKLFYNNRVTWNGIDKMYRWMSEFGLMDWRRFKMMRKYDWRIAEVVKMYFYLESNVQLYVKVSSLCVFFTVYKNWSWVLYYILNWNGVKRGLRMWTILDLHVLFLKVTIWNQEMLTNFNFACSVGLLKKEPLTVIENGESGGKQLWVVWKEQLKKGDSLVHKHEAWWRRRFLVFTLT